MIKEYYIAEATTIKTITQLVNGAINEGFEPFGNLSYTGYRYIQPLIKEEAQMAAPPLPKPKTKRKKPPVVKADRNPLMSDVEVPK